MKEKKSKYKRIKQIVQNCISVQITDETAKTKYSCSS